MKHLRTGSQEGSGSYVEVTMLVLTRKLGESIAIDDHIKIVVVQIKGKQVRLGIKAPPETKIHREEVYKAIQDQNTEAAQTDLSTLSALANELTKK
jgi:carbon storage regulator